MGQVHVAPFERHRVRVCWHFEAEVSRPVECALGQDASSHGRYNFIRVADPVFLLYNSKKDPVSAAGKWSIHLTLTEDRVLFACGDFSNGMTLNALEFGEGRFMPVKKFKFLGVG